MAQGDDVGREAGFEQDASLPVAVQLLDKAVPIDDQAWPKSAKITQKTTFTRGGNTATQESF